MRGKRKINKDPPQWYTVTDLLVIDDASPGHTKRQTPHSHTYITRHHDNTKRQQKETRKKQSCRCRRLHLLVQSAYELTAPRIASLRRDLHLVGFPHHTSVTQVGWLDNDGEMSIVDSGVWGYDLIANRRRRAVSLLRQTSRTSHVCKMKRLKTPNWVILEQLITFAVSHYCYSTEECLRKRSAVAKRSLQLADHEVLSTN